MPLISGNGKPKPKVSYFHQWFEVMWRDFPLMMVTGSHHHCFMIELDNDNNPCAHSAIWIKAHTLADMQSSMDWRYDSHPGATILTLCL